MVVRTSLRPEQFLDSKDVVPGLRQMYRKTVAKGVGKSGKPLISVPERIQEAVKMILDEMRDEGKPIPPDAAILEVESPAVLVTV